MGVVRVVQQDPRVQFGYLFSNVNDPVSGNEYVPDAQRLRRKNVCVLD